MQSQSLCSRNTYLQQSKDKVKLHSAIWKWFTINLEHFGSGQTVVLITAPLLGANNGHLLHNLRLVVSIHIALLLSKDTGSKKKGFATASSPASIHADVVVVDSDEEH